MPSSARGQSGRGQRPRRPGSAFPGWPAAAERLRRGEFPGGVSSAEAASLLRLIREHEAPAASVARALGGAKRPPAKPPTTR